MTISFKELTIFEFDGLKVPVEDVKTSYENSLAIHRMFKENGSLIEPTGRESIVVECDMLFINNLDFYPRDFLSDKDSPLFPDQFQSFRDKHLKNQPGTLKTPDGLEFEAFIHKLSTLSGSKLQNGVVARVSFIETSQYVSKQVFDVGSTVDISADLSNQILVIENQDYRDLLTEIVSVYKSIKSTISMLQLQSQLMTSKINYVVALAYDLISGLETVSMDDYVYAPTTIMLLNKLIKELKGNDLKDNTKYYTQSQDLNNFISATKLKIQQDNKENTSSSLSQTQFNSSIQEKIAANNKTAKDNRTNGKAINLLYYVDYPTPLLELSKIFKNKVEELIKLNPQISGLIIIPANTVITYSYKD